MSNPVTTSTKKHSPAITRIKPPLSPQFRDGLRTLFKTSSASQQPISPLERERPATPSQPLTSSSRIPTEVLTEIFSLAVSSTFDIESWSKSWASARLTRPQPVYDAYSRKWDVCPDDLPSNPDITFEIGRIPVPVAISQVSRRWRDIVLDVPYLWSFVHLEVGSDDEDVCRILERCLSKQEDISRVKRLPLKTNPSSDSEETKRGVAKMTWRLRRLADALVRSNELPLHVTITINLPDTTDPNVIARSFPILRLLMAVCPRWKELYVCAPADAILFFERRTQGMLALLETAMWKTVQKKSERPQGVELHGPRLQHLVLRNEQPIVLSSSITSLVCTSDLDMCLVTRPTLRSLALSGSCHRLRDLSLSQVDLCARSDYARLAFDSLQSLSVTTKLPMLRQSVQQTRQVFLCLDSFVCPKLEVLRLDGCYGAGNNVRDMLVRSGCTLVEMYIKGGLMGTTADLKELFVQATPRLRRLAVVDCTEVTNELLVAMTPKGDACGLPELREFRSELNLLREEVVREFVESRWRLNVIAGENEGDEQPDESGSRVVRLEKVVLDVFAFPGPQVPSDWETELLREGLDIRRTIYKAWIFSFERQTE
ncbi:hypothetical protein V5O48_013665 [Marasmius crinis-equi]|uniref:F-box domain-containing protein n=1 Tax=Marasmius crinis-equi TaxID=585013 RepID=A0ABR3EZG4_9AGAR